jgi:uncharacterized integral membrane protein
MNDRPENSDRPPIAQLIVLTVAIVCAAAILLQNLQPLVKVYFLGQATVPMPFSLAMLAAFLSGALAAAIANSIANAIGRRNSVTAATSAANTSTKDTGVKDNTQQTAKRSPPDEDDDRYTSYPRSGTKTTIQDEADDDDDDDDRDEIYVKYIRR